MQNYFGEAIRRNDDSLKGMLSSIWAIFYHVVIDIKSSLEVQHRFCPKSKDSWCKYWSAPNKYTQEHRLAPVFFDEPLHIFTHLTNEDLLKRRLKGLTQNQNESVNGVLWSRCAKNKFCGKVKVELAVSDTVSHFNSGSASRASLLSIVSNAPTKNMLSTLRKADTRRIKAAANKILVRARQRRRQLRGEKKLNRHAIPTNLSASVFLLKQKVSVEQ